jgi:hypothetical protein
MNKKLSLLFLNVILSLVFTSCMIIDELDAEITLKSNERYKIDMVVSMPTYYLSSGDLADLEDDFYDECRLDDVKCNFNTEEDGDYTILNFSVNGKGYENLSDSDLGYFAYDKENRIVTYSGRYDSLFAYADNPSLTINAKKVITSNGIESLNSVRWNNPVGAYAELEVGGLSEIGITLIILFLCIGLLFGVGIIGLVVFLVTRKKKIEENPPKNINAAISESTDLS